MLVEVNCETDFVARGDQFKELVQDIAMQIAASPAVDIVSIDEAPQEELERERALEMQKEDIQSKPEAIRCAPLASLGLHPSALARFIMCAAVWLLHFAAGGIQVHMVRIEVLCAHLQSRQHCRQSVLSCPGHAGVRAMNTACSPIEGGVHGLA